MLLVPLLAAAFLAIAAPDPTTVTVATAAKSFPVSAAESGALLSIPDFAAGLGGRAQAQPGAALAVEMSGHRIVAADGVATVAFDDRVVVLAHPTRAFSGVLYAPWEFFEKTLLPAAGISAEYDRAGRRIRTRAATAGASTIDVTLVHLARMTQLVFRESAAVDYETAVSRDGFTVTFKRPVVPVTADRSFDDPFVSRVHIAANTAAVVFREPGLSVNAYPLKAPDRLVLEITRPETAAPAPSTSAPKAAPAPAVTPALAPAPAPRAVVIDPGHGGDETGAIGPGNVVEKEITLDIASRLAAILAKDPAVRPVLTRTTDTVVSLDERAAIANHEKATVFVSIHANSSRAAGARGSETYYLSLGKTDPVSAALATEENAAAAPAPGTDGAPADLDFILWDMAQSAHLKESAALAESVQNELNTLLHTENRGIKQAPFRVLVGATMPAILVETAFISNPDEAKKLATPEFRQSIAEAIARAVASYLQLHPAAPPPA